MLQEYPESTKIIGVEENRCLPTATKLPSAVLTCSRVCAEEDTGQQRAAGIPLCQRHQTPARSSN